MQSEVDHAELRFRNFIAAEDANELALAVNGTVTTSVFFTTLRFIFTFPGFSLFGNMHFGRSSLPLFRIFLRHRVCAQIEINFK